MAVLIARNANEVKVESAFGGSLVSGGRLCVNAFRNGLASIALKLLLYLIYFKTFINSVFLIRFAKIMRR